MCVEGEGGGWGGYDMHLSLARKDPCIMETAECHVILQNVVSQSGLLDRCNYSQRIKVSMVSVVV